MLHSSSDANVNGACSQVLNGSQPNRLAQHVLVVGGGPVGCLTAFKLGRSGINVTIIERLSDTSDSPRACRYFGASQYILNELGLYELIRKEGFMTHGLY